MTMAIVHMLLNGLILKTHMVMMEKYCRTIMLQPYYFLPREQKKNITRKVDTIWVLHYVLYILRMERPRNMMHAHIPLTQTNIL